MIFWKWGAVCNFLCEGKLPFPPRGSQLFIPNNKILLVVVFFLEQLAATPVRVFSWLRADRTSTRQCCRLTAHLGKSCLRAGTANPPSADRTPGYLLGWTYPCLLHTPHPLTFSIFRNVIESFEPRWQYQSWGDDAPSDIIVADRPTQLIWIWILQHTNNKNRHSRLRGAVSRKLPLGG